MIVTTTRLALACGALGLMGMPMTAKAQEAAPKPLTLERVFASPNLGGTAPRALKISPDGTLVTLLRNRPDDKERYDLWAIDTSSGAARMLVDSGKVGSGAALSEEEKMQRERARIGSLKGIVSYDWSADSRSILVPLDGDLFLAALDGSVTRLTATPEGELNPVVSPAGRFVSYVRGGNLFVTGLADKREVQVTQGGGGTVAWGVAEFVAQEEMKRSTGYWWSPDDKRIAVTRVDDAPVGIVTRTAIGAEGTRTYDQRYPAAGTPNALVDLYLVNPDGSGLVKVDLGPESDQYLARVDWARDGKTLYVQRQTRDQKRLDLLAVDPATGASRVLFSETQANWINLSDSFRALDDGSLIWWSERSGHGHLYRWKAGQWTQLTSGDWDVEDVVGLDRAKGLIFFSGNRETPLEQQIYSVSIAAPGKVVRVTDDGWWNNAVMDRKGSRFIVSRSNAGQPTQVYIADARGKRIAWIDENRLAGDHPYAPYVASHVLPTFGTLKAADGSALYYSLLTPKLEPGKRYPVFTLHYGGPGTGRTVTNAWRDPLYQALVDRGWIVFALDGRGSPQRGKAFEDQIYKAMGTVEVADQMVGIDWLKAQSFVDPKRIATYGWSYGGYLTLKMLAAHPGAVAAGIAGAPVTRWELYDTHYTERFLGQPKGADNAYPAAGVLGDAARLTDPLLLMHGMSDDNVVLENTTALMGLMQEKALPFEVMLYPGKTHSVSGEGPRLHVWRTILDFLARQGVAPDAP